LIELNQTSQNSDRQSMLASVKTIFFAGTPHGGLRTDEMKRMAKQQLGIDNSMVDLLKQLQEDSEYLELQKKGLIKIWSFIRKVVTFYETVKTPTARRVIMANQPRWEWHD